MKRHTTKHKEFIRKHNAKFHSENLPYPSKSFNKKRLKELLLILVIFYVVILGIALAGNYYYSYYGIPIQ